MPTNEYVIQELEFGYAILKHGERIATFANKTDAERFIATVSSAQLKKVEVPPDSTDYQTPGT